MWGNLVTRRVLIINPLTSIEVLQDNQESTSWGFSIVMKMGYKCKEDPRSY